MPKPSILEYNPQLEMKPEIKAVIETGSEVEAIDVAAARFTPSPALSQLKGSSPSDAIEALDAAMSVVDSRLAELLEPIRLMSSGGITIDEYKAAVLSGDFEIIDAFEDPIASDIEGDVRMEVLAPILLLQQDLSELQGFIKEMSYGPGVDSKTAAKIDKALQEKLYELEESGQTEAINYDAINMDIQLSQLMQLHAANILGSMEMLDPILQQEIPDGSGVSDKEAEEVRNLLQKTFSTDVDTVRNDKVKLRQNQAGTQKNSVLSGIYDKRRAYLDGARTAGILDSVPVSAVQNKMVQTLDILYNESSDGILDSYKVIQMEALYLQDFLSTSAEKQFTRNTHQAYKR